MNERAKTYRRINNIDDFLGTAVNVQAMVFGNLGETSGTGVGFTRNPATGVKEFYGEFLMNAQGEDVVAGIRTPVHISELEKIQPDVYNQLREITTRLEKHYRDMQDFEFTIQDGRLYMLQTRNGKRTGRAAVRVAIQMVEEGLITKEEAIFRVEPNQLYDFLVPSLDEKGKDVEVLATGLASIAGRGCRADRLHRRRSGGKVQQRLEREADPGSQRDHARRYWRHGSRGRHSDLPRWHDQPCRSRDARHGQVLRGRRRRYRG